MICGREFLIANIDECTIEASQHNPNVYFEAGLASEYGKTVIWLRPRSSTARPVPIDIRGLTRVEYSNEVDLAVRLYFGLRP